MTGWPREIGSHTVDENWECTDCGASFDCLSQFRTTNCEAHGE